MFIEMQDNKMNGITGQVISGTVNLNQREDFPGRALYINFTGEDGVKIRNPSTDDNSTHRYKTNNFIDLAVKIAEFFPSEICPAGQYSFPFSIQLPDWLPSSVMHANREDDATLGIFYLLKAEMKCSPGAFAGAS